VCYSATGGDLDKAAVARAGGGGGTRGADLVAAPTQGPQVSGQAGSSPAQVELLFIHFLEVWWTLFRILFRMKMVTLDPYPQ